MTARRAHARPMAPGAVDRLCAVLLRLPAPLFAVAIVGATVAGAIVLLAAAYGAAVLLFVQ